MQRGREEGEGIGEGLTGRSVTPFNSFFFTRTMYRRILQGIHTACPRMTPSTESFMALLRRHRGFLRVRLHPRTL